MLDAHGADKYIVHADYYRCRTRGKQSPLSCKFIKSSRILAKQQTKPCESVVGLGAEAILLAT